MALRERVVAFVEKGHSHLAAAARFEVSVRFVNDMVIQKREAHSLEPRTQGNGGGPVSWPVIGTGSKLGCWQSRI
jgi:transposase